MANTNSAFDKMFLNWDLDFASAGVKEIEFRNYLKRRYSTNDCIVLDKNIKEAKDTLAYLLTQKLASYPMPLATQPEFVKQSLNDLSKTTIQSKKEYGEKMSNLLSLLVLRMENTFAEATCRNEIEKTRLNDMASVITQQAIVQEQSILKPNFKEQYIYIGIGAVVLLVGLYLISTKNS
jgi:hypothetical protein